MYQKMLFIIMIIIPMAKCGLPGTFYWRPRLSIDLSIPSTPPPTTVRKLTKDNIHEGLVVLIDGYGAGLTVISIACGLAMAVGPMPHLNPFSAFFYTNMYRWALRYFSNIPHWIGGNGPNYVETHKVWRRRFYYMDEFIPEWLKKALPYIKKEEWDKEYLDWKRFKKYSESAFGKHYRFPTKHFNNFRSQLTHESIGINYDDLSSESDV